MKGNHEQQWLLDNLGSLSRKTIYARAWAIGIYRQICDLIGEPEPQDVPERSREPIVRSTPCAGCRQRKDIP